MNTERFSSVKSKDAWRVISWMSRNPRISFSPIEIGNIYYANRVWPENWRKSINGLMRSLIRKGQKENAGWKVRQEARPGRGHESLFIFTNSATTGE